MICFLSLCLPEAGILHRCREENRSVVRKRPLPVLTRHRSVHRLLPVSGVFSLLMVLVSNGAARAQTACAEQYTSSGAFICYAMWPRMAKTWCFPLFSI